jgi:hypothetical protein
MPGDIEVVIGNNGNVHVGPLIEDLETFVGI